MKLLAPVRVVIPRRDSMKKIVIHRPGTVNLRGAASAKHCG
jgi:hypothetical protein